MKYLYGIAFVSIIGLVGVLSMSEPEVGTPLGAIEKKHQEFSIKANQAHTSIETGSSTIINATKGLSRSEKIHINSSEIVRKTPKGDFTKGEYHIEIIDIEAIEGGIQVFAKASWRGEPVGFGKDGTVAIERFRIYNPPILVNDPNGNIVTEIPASINAPSSTYKYREDPKEALRVELEDIIKTIKKDGANIVVGKVGNTTTIVYPDADPESTSFDGASGVDYKTSWTTVRDASTADFSDDSGTTIFPRAFKDGTTESRYGVTRLFILFDTSGIPDTDNIDSVSLSLWANLIQDTDNFVLQGGTPASDTGLTGADYIAMTVDSPTEYATRKSSADWGTIAYEPWSLNATGISNVDATDITELVLRLEHDVDDDPPPNATYYGNRFHSADGSGGTANAPKLIIEHSAGDPSAVISPSRNIDW